MANKRQRNPQSRISVRSILLHPAGLFLLATCLVIGGAISLWNHNRERIIEVTDFQLNSESIQLNAPAPTWTHSDLKEMLVDQFLEQSTLDPELVPNTASFIRSVGWVEKINNIQKSRSGLSIDLTYRNPVAVVKINDNQLVPVDRQGVILDYDPTDLGLNPPLLIVSMFRPNRPGTKLHAWQKWPDERVVRAAAIGNALRGQWIQLGLIRIVTFQLPGENAELQPFELWTKGHVDPNDVSKSPFAAKVIWGNAPGFEKSEEASAHQKLQAIKDFIDQRGPLAKSIPKGKLLDIRTGTAIVTSQVRTAEQINLFKELR